MLPYRTTNFQRAFHRRFRRIIKNQRHPVAGWNCYQPMVSVGFPKLFRLADDLVQRLELAALLIDQELGVADDVDKEHVGYLELDLLFNLRHRLKGGSYAFATENPRLFFGREGGDDLFEAGIAVERVPEGMKL